MLESWDSFKSATIRDAIVIILKLNRVIQLNEIVGKVKLCIPTTYQYVYTKSVKHVLG